MPHINFKKNLQVTKWCRLKVSGTLDLDKELLKLIDARLSSCQVTYQFYEEQKIHILKLHIKCQISLQCQRCKEDTNQPLKSSSTLVLSLLVNPEIENLIESLGFELFVYNNQTSFLDILREEIDLNIPNFPKCLKNCKSACMETVMEKSELTQRPFANLKTDLKIQRNKNNN